MVKSFITFYLVQYHKNAFHDELFYILQMEFHFPGLLKNHTQFLVLRCLEDVTNKKGLY